MIAVSYEVIKGLAIASAASSLGEGASREAIAERSALIYAFIMGWLVYPSVRLH